jgi:tripeptide aminopeptidase
MINALLLAMEFQNMLPVEQNPMYTEHYEGFYMLSSLEGSVDSARASYIIRDHDKAKFEQKKENFQKIADYLNNKYGEGTFKTVIKDSYYNMKEKIEPHIHLIDNARKAMEELGVTPITVPIRGGTDGSRLSYMNLPCPNLCTGGHNFHGRYEYIPIQSMEKVTEIILKIIELYSKK